MRSRNIVDLRGKRPAAARKPQAPARVNISSVSARTSPLRVKRRRTRFVILAVCTVLIGIIAFELSYVSYLPRYTISALAVEGTHTLSPKLVERYVETQLHAGTHPFFAPNNIFLYHPADIERGIVRFFPRIKSVKVSRTSLLANVITVKIEERKEFARWCASPGVWRESPPSGCYSMDDGGSIFAEAASSSAGLIFSGGLVAQEGFSSSTSPIGRFFSPGHLPGILALLDQLGRVDLTPTGAYVDDNGSDFAVPLMQGFEVKASFGQDTNTLVHNLQLILSADVLQGKQGDIQYVDLRFGDRAYYKLKSSNAASTSTVMQN
ncbi:hypothetical protein HZC00_00175 [Candidatus Kaiserbacteria bacterium]|nr:hypothetical protein [Candidatus Kaiserbacteria bacterium]